jgi:uncharacterized protein Yka (UPF0111/DUF47 family)|uniref:Heat shock factor binding protein 1 n=1 Tax=Panagrolaimus sp. PS1159 TaxID=55785 RepID=A0AC35FXE9_9BILA
MSSIKNETLDDGGNMPSDHYSELLSAVDSTLKATQERFAQMQEKILRRLDDMSDQLKDLEKRVDNVIEDIGKNKFDEFST